METRFEVIAGQAGAELVRRGIDPQRRVMITVDVPQTDAEKLADLRQLAQERLQGIDAGHIVDADTFFARARAKLQVP